MHFGSDVLNTAMLVLFGVCILGVTLFVVGRFLIDRYFERRERIIKQFENERGEL